MNNEPIYVALSCAHDRMILVRSIDSSHVPSLKDVEILILKFFTKSATMNSNEDVQECRPTRLDCFVPAHRLSCLLKTLHHDKGCIGVVWNDAICVKDNEVGRRAAVCFE